MLSFDRHRNLSLIVSLLRFIVLLLQSYAIGNRLHRFSYHIQLLSRLLDRAAHGRDWLQTVLKQIDKSITVIFAHARYVKRNSIDFELSFGLIVVKLRLIEGDEFQDYHTDGKDICLVYIILDVILHLIDVVKLLWRQDVAIDLRSFSSHLEVATVPILLFHLQQIQLDVALGTQINRACSILSHRNAIFLKVTSSLKQSSHYIHQLSLREKAILQFLLLYRCLKCEIVVVAKGVYFLVFDAHLILYIYGQVHSINWLWCIFAKFLCYIFFSCCMKRMYLPMRSLSSMKFFLKSITYSYGGYLVRQMSI